MSCNDDNKCSSQELIPTLNKKIVNSDNLSCHLSHSLNELEKTQSPKMNYLRNRFQRSTSYDHERGLSATRGSGVLSNNTDKLLKDIRSKRIRASTAAQNVSDNIISSVFKREKSIPRNDTENYYSFRHDSMGKTTSSLLATPPVSSPKSIPYAYSNSPDLFSLKNTYSPSQTYVNGKSTYTSFTSTEHASDQKSYNFPVDPPQIVSEPWFKFQLCYSCEDMDMMIII